MSITHLKLDLCTTSLKARTVYVLSPKTRTVSGHCPESSLSSSDKSQDCIMLICNKPFSNVIAPSWILFDYADNIDNCYKSFRYPRKWNTHNMLGYIKVTRDFDTIQNLPSYHRRSFCFSILRNRKSIWLSKLFILLEITVNWTYILP